MISLGSKMVEEFKRFNTGPEDYKFFKVII